MQKYKERSSPVYPPPTQEIKYCKDSWSFLYMYPWFFLSRWCWLLFNKENKSPPYCNSLSVLPSIIQTSLLPSPFPPVFGGSRSSPLLSPPLPLALFSLPHYQRTHSFLILNLYVFGLFLVINTELSSSLFQLTYKYQSQPSRLYVTSCPSPGSLCSSWKFSVKCLSTHTLIHCNMDSSQCSKEPILS